MNTSTDPLIGRTISQYEVVARIGGGGMGVVYKATDLKLGRTVALKFLPPQWSHDEGAKQRFLREAQAASATNHRNICIIHDIAHTDDGQLFIVMAYYEGQTLKERLERGPLPALEALEIATEVAEGLAKAHAQGVVHRDVKPGNLMITEDGVKVLDFGLAKFADALQLTMPGSTVGTVAYMSPEQARGEEADARSDVWALGVVLYEMLSGRVPFAGAYPEAIFHAIKNEPVPLLTSRDIPSPLQTLVCRALEKDPARRYQSAREMARDLRLLQGRTVPLDLRTETLTVIHPLSAAPEKTTWQQRARGALTRGRVIAALAVLAIAAAATYLYMSRPIVRVPVVIAPMANHTGDPELDSYRLALTEGLITELAGSPSVSVVPYLRLLEVIRRFILTGDVSSTEAIQAIASQGGARFVAVPSLEYANGTWFALAEIRSSETGTVVASFQTEGLASSLPKDTAHRLVTALADRVETHFADGRGVAFARRPASARFRNLDAARSFEVGLSEYEQLEYSSALASFEQAASLDAQHVMTQVWLSRVLLLLSRRDDAAAAGLRARQLVTSDTPARDRMLVEAVLAESQADAATAERQYRQLAERYPDDLSAQADLADFLKRQNQNQAATLVYEEVRRRDARYARVQVDLCQIQLRIGDYPLATQQATQARDRFREIGNRGGEAQALLCLADAQRAQGGAERLADARRNLESAQTIFESLDNGYGLSRVSQYFGNLAYDGRDYPTAARYYAEALSRSRSIGNRVTEGNALMNLGVTWEFLGEREQVLKYYEEARAFYERNGDAARAAEQEANTAALLIDYGSEPDAALRRLLNARATFEKLGNVDFHIITIEMEGARAMHAGRHDEARRLLRMALSLARDRQRGNRAVFVTLRLAESLFMTAEYEEARSLLEEVAATPAGEGELAVPIALGRIHERLGDVEGARQRLSTALTAVESSGQRWLAPQVLAALGELEADFGNTRDARAYFAKSSGYWVDDLPHVASVEARCRGAVLDVQDGAGVSHQEAVNTVTAGIEQARRMGRLFSEVLCRVQKARLEISERQYAAAHASLDGIPLDGPETVGKELQAQVLFMRSQALAGRSDRTAEAEADKARQLVTEIGSSLTEPFRERFAARLDIRQIIQWSSGGAAH